MKKEKILEAANYIYENQRNHQEIEKITLEKYPEMTPEEAYEVQSELIKLYEADGYNVLAPKLGLTSKAKWEQMNVDSPIVGYVFDEFIVKGNTVDMRNYIHPKVEPEIAIVLKNEIGGEDLTIEEIEENIDYVISAAEVIDSRYKDFDFTLVDVIADNTSAAGAIFSDRKIKPEEIDWKKEKSRIFVNNKLVETGNGEAVLGHPLEAIVYLAKHLAKEGKKIKAGVPIMTGGMSAAVLVKPGDLVEVCYSTLGTIEIQVVGMAY